MTQYYSDFQNYFSSFKNKLINGDFDIWQRSVSASGSGYNSDDRWYNGHTGSSKTHSRQSFTVGQTDVPNNPKYYSRTVVTSSAGASNNVYKVQPIESVYTFSGKTITLSFWAKADANRNIATEFYQAFGSGGSPSSEVNAIGVTTHSLTISWQKFTVTVDIPSISGKTLGTDNNDDINLTFWFDAGSNFDSRTNSLGQQSGTFDIAQVQLEEGSIATQFEKRPIGQEVVLCQRYYEKSYNLSVDPGTVTNEGATVESAVRNGANSVPGTTFKVSKRTVPTITVYSNITGTSAKVYNNGDKSVISANPGESGMRYISITSGDLNLGCNYHWAADAEL